MTGPNTEKIAPYQWTLFTLCFLSVAFGGMVSTLMSIYLPDVMKELQQNDAEQLAHITAYINAAFIFGWAIGGFVWGMIADKTGRKKAFILCVGCYGLFTILTGRVSDWQMIACCRLASGFGMGGLLVVSTTLMIEEWNEKSKAVFMGILSISMPVGIFSAGWLTHSISNWRTAFLIGAAPVLLSILSAWAVQESVTWKTGSKRLSPEEKNLFDIFSPSYRKDLLIGSTIFGSMLVGLWAIFLWLPTWMQNLPANQHSNGNTALAMMIFGAGGLTGGFLSGWLLNAIGSRKSMLLCFVACSISAFLLFRTNTAFNRSIYFEILGLSLFFGASQGVLSVYIPELFPVNIRATATGFCFNIGRLFTATAVLFVGLLQSSLGGYGNALFTFSFVFVIGLIATLISPSDRKTTLEWA